MKPPIKFLFLISLTAFAVAGQAQDVWVGNSATTSNWSDGDNWQSGMAPQNGDPLLFQGSNRTTNTNDLLIADIDSFTFDPNAAEFTLQGKTLGLLSNGITNNSSNLQTFDFQLPNANLVGHSGLVLYEPDTTINAASGDLLFLCNIEGGRVNVFGPATLTVTGDFNTTISGILQDDQTNPTNTLVLVKSGAGTLILANDNNYTGGTTINSGTVVVGSTNPFGSAATNNNVHLDGGTLQTDTPRTFNVPFDYFQSSGSTLRLQIGGLAPGTHDLVQVVHDANLGGDLFVHQFGGFVPTNGDRVTVLTTNIPCTVVGTWDGVSSDFPGLLQPMPEYFQDHVDLVFQLSQSFGSQGETPNQKAVGHGLDHAMADGCVPELTNFLGNESPELLPHQYDLIAPEELASIYEIGFSQAMVHNDNLMRRMDDIRAGSNGYCGPVVQTTTASGDYNPPISDKNVAMPDKNVAPAFVPCPENRWGIFATGTGDFVNVDGDDNARGYDIDTGSFIAGVDYRIGNHFAIGIDGGYASSRADLVNHGHIDVDGGKIGGYATVYGFRFLGGNIHLDGGANGGWNNYDTRRTGLDDLNPIMVYDDHARGSTNGSEFNAFISYGTDYNFGCLTIGTWSTIQYTDVSIDSFTEEGSLAPLHIQDQSQDSFRGTTGIRASYDIRFGHCGIIRPEIRAAWQHESSDRSYAIDANFIDCDDTFTVHGPKIGRDSALVGAALNVQWCARFASYVYYDGVLGRDNYDNNAVSGGFRFGF